MKEFEKQIAEMKITRKVYDGVTVFNLRNCDSTLAFLYRLYIEDKFATEAGLVSLTRLSRRNSFHHRPSVHELTTFYSWKFWVVEDFDETGQGLSVASQPFLQWVEKHIDRIKKRVAAYLANEWDTLGKQLLGRLRRLTIESV